MRYKKEMFQNLYFEDNEHVFMNYLEYKGIFLHKQVYDAFMNYRDRVSYKDLSQYIRYDKGIRNTLYKFLAALEEYYRSKLINSYDINYELKNPEKSVVKEKDIIKANKDTSNLYYYSFSKHFSFGNLLNILNDLKILDGFEKKELEEIRLFRNKVMHHNLLIIGLYKTKDEIERNILSIERKCELIHKYLPEAMKDAFEKEVNRCNHLTLKNRVPNLEILCLGEMINGIFIKEK